MVGKRWTGFRVKPGMTIVVYCHFGPPEADKLRLESNGGEKVDWILENHHPQPLEVTQQDELTHILEAAERELG